jgi:hypothetical protein
MLTDGFDLNEVVKSLDGDSIQECQNPDKSHSLVLVLRPLIQFTADGGND